MSEREIYKISEEEKLFHEREKFIRENYPEEESNLDLEKIISDSLEGFKILEERNKTQEIESMLSYDIQKDNEGTKYCRIGIALVREELRGEGKIKKLFLELKGIAQKESCEYFTAVADTLGGEELFEVLGFYPDEDRINGRHYYRYDL